MRAAPRRLVWVITVAALAATTAMPSAYGSGGLDVENRTLTSGTLGVTYPTEEISAVGAGVTPYSWTVSAGSLPSGLSLTTVNNKGRISGIPDATGTYTFTLQVADSATATATRNFVIPIYPVLQVTSSSLPAGVVGLTYSAALSASGGSGSYTSWSIISGALPPGLTLAAGVISGTPTAVGFSEFMVRVTDSVGITMDRTLGINVEPSGQLAIAATPVGQVTVNIPYNLQLTASGGSRIYSRWAVVAGNLPTGLSLNATAGLISGTPSSTGTFTATVQVADSDTTTATRILTFTVGTSPCAADDTLGPITSAQNSSLPPAGLPAGRALVLECGSPHTHTLAALPTDAPVAIQVRSFATSLRTEGRNDGGQPTGIRDGNVALLHQTSGSTVGLSGGGALPRSTVRAWILPSTSLGSFIADADGAFSAIFAMPPGIMLGSQTVQVNMLGPDRQVRSVSLGVAVVEPPRATTRIRLQASVRFRPSSAKLTGSAQARLDNLIERIGEDAVLQVSVRGYARDPVRPGTSSATRRRQNLALAGRRAAAVAQYLRSNGVSVAITQQARRPGGNIPGAKARRVNVSVVVSRIT